MRSPIIRRSARHAEGDGKAPIESLPLRCRSEEPRRLPGPAAREMKTLVMDYLKLFFGSSSILELDYHRIMPMCVRLPVDYRRSLALSRSFFHL